MEFWQDHLLHHTFHHNDGHMGFDDQFYAASKRPPASGANDECPKKKARREEKQKQKELERKTKVR